MSRTYTHSPYGNATPDRDHTQYRETSATPPYTGYEVDPNGPQVQLTTNVQIRRGHGRTLSSNSQRSLHSQSYSVDATEEYYGGPPPQPGPEVDGHTGRPYYPVGYPGTGPAGWQPPAPSHTPTGSFHQRTASGGPAVPPAYVMTHQASHSTEYSTNPPMVDAGNQRQAPHQRRQSSRLSTDSQQSSGGQRKRMPHGPSPSMPSIFHTQLTNCVEFQPFPSPDQLASLEAALTGIETEHALFFGQVKFEATACLILWIIQLLTRGAVWPTHVHPRGAGCFMAYFNSEDECRFVQSFNDSVLFDESGIWIGWTEKEREVIRQYASEVGANLRGVRLPKGCMVIRR
jgi:hypothetical protein